MTPSTCPKCSRQYNPRNAASCPVCAAPPPPPRPAAAARDYARRRDAKRRMLARRRKAGVCLRCGDALHDDKTTCVICRGARSLDPITREAALKARRAKKAATP